MKCYVVISCPSLVAKKFHPSLLAEMCQGIERILISSTRMRMCISPNVGCSKGCTKHLPKTVLFSPSEASYMQSQEGQKEKLIRQKDMSQPTLLLLKILCSKVTAQSLVNGPVSFGARVGGKWATALPVFYSSYFISLDANMNSHV